MVALLAWPGAIAIGLSLGLLGSGGSILTVPVLVYLIGVDEKVAIASSLAIVGVIALVGSVPYARERLVDWRSVVLFGIPGMMGTYAGAWSSVFVDGSVQLAVFAVVMLLASVLMLHPLDCSRRTDRPPRSPAKITADGLLIGWLTGFVGVGGGFLIVPALVLLGGLSIHRAVATSLIIIALKSAVGFAKYVDVLEGEGLILDPAIIAMVSLFGIAGSFIGNYAGKRLSTQWLQRAFGVFLVVMGAYVLGTSIPDILQGGTP